MKPVLITFLLMFFSGFDAVMGQYPEAPLRPAWDKGVAGYVDSITGKLVIPYKYRTARRFYKGLAITEDKKGNYGIIDIKGKAVFPHSCRYISFNSENELYIAELNEINKSGVLDCNLKQIMPFQYESIKPLGKVLMVKRWYTLNGDFDDYFGFYKPSGECLVPEEITHEPAEIGKEFMGNVMDGMRGLVRPATGELTIPFIYRSVLLCPDEKAIIAADDAGKFFLFDITGKKMTENAWEYVNCQVSGFFPVKLNGKWGFCKDGNTGPIIYDKIDSVDYADGTFILAKDKRQGVADFSGKEIVPFEYDRVSRYSTGYFLTTKNGRSGLVDGNGKTIVPCQFINIPFQPGKGGFVLEDEYGRFGAYDENGVNIVPFVVDEELVNSSYDVARKYIAQLLSILPGQPKINYLAALGYYARKKPEEALPLVSSLIDNCDGSMSYPLLYIRAKIYTDLNDFKNAENDARRATDMVSPWRTMAFIYMGDKKFRQQDFKTAEEYYTYAGLFFKSEEADRQRLLAIEELKKRGQWHPSPSGIKPEEPVANLTVTILNFTTEDRMEYAGDFKFKRLYSWAEAVSGCPRGYRMPTLEDWLGVVNYILKDQQLSEKTAYKIIDYIGKGWTKRYYEEKVLKTNTLIFKSENTYNLNITPLRSHFYTIELSEFQESNDVVEYWFEPSKYNGQDVNTIEFMNNGFELAFREKGKACVRYVKIK